MPPQRVLLLAPAVARDSRTVDATPADAEGPEARQQGREKQRRHRHTAEEWEDMKESFKELYFQEDSSLEDVKQEMERDYGFEARYVRGFGVKIRCSICCSFLNLTCLLAFANTRSRSKNGG